MKTKSMKICIALLIALSVAPMESCSSSGGPVIFAAGGRRGFAGQLWVIDPIGKRVAFIGNIGFPIGDIAFAPDGTLYGTTVHGYQSQGQGDLITINPATGEGTKIEDISTGNSIGGLAFVGETLFAWVAYNSGGAVGTLDTSDGTFTELIDDDCYGNGLAYDKIEERLVAACEGDDGDLSLVNTTTGVRTQLVDLVDLRGNGDGIDALAFLGGKLYGVMQNWNGTTVILIEIDVETGDVTEVMSLPTSISGLATF